FWRSQSTSLRVQKPEHCCVEGHTLLGRVGTTGDKLPDWEPETGPRREWLERILRRQLLVDIDADPASLVEIHIALLHLRAAGKDFLNHLPPTEIHILLNAEIRCCEIHMALRRMVDRVDVSWAVPAARWRPVCGSLRPPESI